MFVKGQSGNPAGRPKKDPAVSKTTLVKEAWDEICKTKPWMVKEALERGLEGARPLGFLELGARLNKEIGQQENQKAQVTIVVNSPLNAGTLRPIDVTPMPLAIQAHPALPESTEVDVTLLEEVKG